ASTPEAAVERLAELHRAASDALNHALKRYFKDRVAPDPQQRALFRYPELRLTWLGQEAVPVTIRAYARVQSPGVYSVSVTQPDSPYPEVVKGGGGWAGSVVSAAALVRVFASTDLSAASDGVADGLFDWQNAERMPLALFDAARVDYSLKRIQHYSGSDWRH